jgi:hypothetical protein
VDATRTARGEALSGVAAEHSPHCAAATSARECEAASAVFFEREGMPHSGRPFNPA